MQPITIVGVVLCFVVLYLRYKSQGARAGRSTGKQRLKTGKMLVSALLVLMAIGYALRRLDSNLDGENPEPSLMERVVAFLSK